MFRIFFDKNGDIVYTTTAMDDEPIDSQWQWLDIDILPSYDHYRQIVKVKENQLIVEDLELTAEEEMQIIEIEIRGEISTYEQYLIKTDYVAMKLSEIVSRAMISGDLTELNAFNDKYSEVLMERQNARDNIDDLRQMLQN